MKINGHFCLSGTFPIARVVPIKKEKEGKISVSFYFVIIYFLAVNLILKTRGKKLHFTIYASYLCLTMYSKLITSNGKITDFLLYQQ